MPTPEGGFMTSTTNESKHEALQRLLLLTLDDMLIRGANYAGCRESKNKPTIWSGITHGI